MYDDGLERSSYRFKVEHAFSKPIKPQGEWEGFRAFVDKYESQRVDELIRKAKGLGRGRTIPPQQFEG